MTSSEGKAARVAAAAEIVSAVAVVVGLLFVGLELRRNTAAVEAATFQDLTDVSNTWIMTIASDADLSRILREGNERPDDLTAADRQRYSLIERAFWVRMQNVYSQYVRGTLSAEDWSLYEAVMCAEGTGGPPAGRLAVWPQQRPVLSAALIDLVEDCWRVAR